MNNQLVNFTSAFQEGKKIQREGWEDDEYVEFNGKSTTAAWAVSSFVFDITFKGFNYYKNGKLITNSWTPSMKDLFTLQEEPGVYVKNKWKVLD